jgi:hypothetical protein
MAQKINPIKIFLLCPIPEEQKPIHEYINLKKYFSKKIDLQFKEKSQNFFIDQIFLFLFFLNKIVSTFFFILRWKEIEKRFNQSSLVYEEGSWYDGQIWEKSFSMIKKDRLLNSQIVQASLPRLKDNLQYSFVLLISFFSFLLLNLFFH